MKKLALVVALLSLLLAGATGAKGDTGEALILGRNNCTTPSPCPTNGKPGATSLNWDASEGTLPGGYGLAVSGGVMTSSREELADAYSFLSPGGTALEAYGGDWGGFFFGMDGGLMAHGREEGENPGVVGLGAVGVKGIGTEGGGPGVGVVAVAGSDPANTALQTDGRVDFSTAGLITIPKGKASITFPAPAQVTSSSLIVATVQSAGGSVKRAYKDAVNQRYTIVLNAAATQNTVVGYFIIG